MAKKNITKDDLRKVIESIKRGDETNVDKLTDRIWTRMQNEPEGTSMPRREFFEFLYDKSFVQEANDILRKMDKGVVVKDTVVPVPVSYPAIADANRGEMPIHSIAITDAVRSSVEMGQPLYAVRSEEEESEEDAVDYKPQMDFVDENGNPVENVTGLAQNIVDVEREIRGMAPEAKDFSRDQKTVLANAMVS